MAIAMNGKMGNNTNLASITAALKTPAHIYMGFSTTAISDTSTLATIAESSDIARFEVTSNLGTPALDSGVPTLKNSSAITSGNSSGEGEQIVAWFLTTVESALTGDIIAYGNIASGAIYTNTGVPVSVAIDGLVVQID